MMQHYYTADLHLRHEKVAKIRGFDSVLEHDRAIVKSLIVTLKPEDHLWVLGDVSGGKDEIAALYILRSVVDTCSAQLHLISGNHDSIHPMHRRSELAHFKFRSTFSSIDSMGTFRHDRDKVLLSHFPYAGDRGEDRYPEYRLRDTGKPIVHGHTHSSEKVSYSDKGSLQICVSLDAWGLKPAPKHELVKLIESQTS